MQCPNRILVVGLLRSPTFPTKGSTKRLHLFNQMQALGFEPNCYILPSALRSCSNLSDLKTGRILHSLITRSLLSSDLFINGALINLYYKCNKLETARWVFDETAERDLVLWNSIISGYAHLGLTYHALVLLIKMQSCWLKRDLSLGNSVSNGGRHFVFKPSPSRHPLLHLKWRFEKYQPIFLEKSDMSADILRKTQYVSWS